MLVSSSLVNVCHECVGLSLLPALHSFGPVILNTSLAERLCLCVDCFELTFV